MIKVKIIISSLGIHYRVLYVHFPTFKVYIWNLFKSCYFGHSLYWMPSVDLLYNYPCKLSRKQEVFMFMLNSLFTVMGKTWSWRLSRRFWRACGVYATTSYVSLTYRSPSKYNFFLITLFLRKLWIILKLTIVKLLSFWIILYKTSFLATVLPEAFSVFT